MGAILATLAINVTVDAVFVQDLETHPVRPAKMIIQALLTSWYTPPRTARTRVPMVNTQTLLPTNVCSATRTA